MVQVNNRITAKDSELIVKELSNDLTDYYRSLQDDILETLVKGEKEGWNEDKMIQEVSRILEE